MRKIMTVILVHDAADCCHVVVVTKIHNDDVISSVAPPSINVDDGKYVVIKQKCHY
jgi:hypothetical protein